eukprot:TRINITY_DN619_c4_g1_i1.p1 TRINITY_DN619_c4_g1~~TRINITY_DN619_c4_g1_i1.p1  ORF type:complete len:349 (+),score=65.51 TRINITY_DN619_c4_g1_i1:72-1118(+)
MKKFLLAAGVIIPLAAYYGWMWLTGPCYVPGNLKNVKLNAVPKEKDKRKQLVDVGDGITLYQETSGDEGKGIFFIHGGPGKAWNAPWKKVPKGAFSHFYHQRGCGLSTRPIETMPGNGEMSFMKNAEYLTEKLGFEQDVLDIERLRMAFGYEKVTLVGHSWGGFIASMYASEFPDNIEKLVLLSPAAVLVFPPPPEKDLFKIIEDRLDDPTDKKVFHDHIHNVVLDFSPAMWKKSDEQICKEDSVLDRYYFAAMKVDTTKVPLPKYKAGGWATKGSFMSLGMHHDYVSSLSNITCPTLLAECENDAINDPLYRKIDGVKVVRIPECTHMPFEENLDFLLNEIDNFLEY